MLPIIDANVILRYLLNDNVEQAVYAARVIESGCETTHGIIAEVVYVLMRVYHVPRHEIADVLLSLINKVYLQDRETVRIALDQFRETGLDFIDCLLIGMHQVDQREIITFDKKLLNALS